MTLQVLYRILEESDELPLPYIFALSIFHHISDPAMRAHIDREGAIFYSHE